MDDTRRDFLKKAGAAALGVGVGLPIIGAARTAFTSSAAHGAASTAKQWGMVIDINKCQNPALVGACVDACNREHNIPLVPIKNEEVKWIWTEGFKNVFSDQVHSRMADDLKEKKVIVLCNHCASPSCVRVCPTGATWKRKSDGVVMMDMHRCIGCRYCMAACPYGARSFNWSDPRRFMPKDYTSDYPTRTKGVVEKCTFCAERIREGRQPACVEAAAKVPGGEGALVFGNLSDPNEEVSRILREKHTICRRPELGTGPNVYYII